MRDFRKFCLKKQEQVIPTPDQGTIGGHDYVEIGGVKWATMNIGANSVADYGLYYQWGGTTGYTSDSGSGGSSYHCNWQEYPFAELNPDWDGVDENNQYLMTKYNLTDGKNQLEPEDDIVTLTYGEGWHMPSSLEFGQPFSHTTQEVIGDYLDSGVSGILFTDKNNSSKKLFFPYTLMIGDGSKSLSNFSYWTNNLSYNTEAYQETAYFDYSEENPVFLNSAESLARNYGLAVRGVYGESQIN